MDNYLLLSQILLAQLRSPALSPATESVNHFMMGGIAVGYAMAALFFLRFWAKTHDRLFVMFGIAFAILGSVRVAIFTFGQQDEHHFLYWFRFAAYMLILLAIIDKNRTK